jgi:hypothetical protein
MANGATISGGDGGTFLFWDNSKLDNATLNAHSGTNGGSGGSIEMSGKAKGGGAQIRLLGDGTINPSNGRFDISAHDKRAADISVGSIEGSGEIILGASGHGDNNNLIVGSNNLTTTFSGVIHGVASGGILTKTGTGGLG